MSTIERRELDREGKARNLVQSFGLKRGEVSRAALLASASLIALAAFGGPGAAYACSGADQTISHIVHETVVSTGGSITVDPGKGIFGAPDGVDAFNCDISTLMNGGGINAAMGSLGATGGTGVSNRQTIATLTNGGTISGGAGGGASSSFILPPSGGAGVSNHGTITSFTNNATIRGGVGGSAGTIARIGGLGGLGVGNAGTITSLTNNGSIVGGMGGVGGAQSGGPGGSGVGNKGTITTLTNSGTISGGQGGIAGVGSRVGGPGLAGVANEGRIGSLTNQTNKTISGGQGASGPGGGRGGTGFFQGGGSPTATATIASLTNNGLIIGGAGGEGTTSAGGAGGTGVLNFAFTTISTFSNAGSISGGQGGAGKTSGGGGGAGVVNGITALSQRGSATITTLNNSGVIVGGVGGAAELTAGGKGGSGGAGVANVTGTITTLTNKGLIVGGFGGGGLVAGATGAGVWNSGGTITTLNNSGTISGSEGVLNTGHISTLNNLIGGHITGAKTGVANSGTIGSLLNLGTISGGTYAIYSPGANSISSYNNPGTTIGNVAVDPTAPFLITGGSGKSFGVFKGGTITIVGGDLVFQGNTELADDIKVNDGRGTVTNDGVLRLATPETITGNFEQTASGVLDFLLAGDSAGDYGALAVKGGVRLDGELALDPVDGFRLMGGDTFDLMTFSPDGGAFTGVSLEGVACSATLSTVWKCGATGFNLDVAIGLDGIDVTVASIPEPSTWAMLATGFLGLAGLGLKARKRTLAL
jgi:hypothetical protein